MDFARKQLEKYGWKEGRGLGRNEDGIADALKPKLKFDKTGVGHSPGEQFTDNWWERLFNSASNNINVQVSNGNVNLMRNSEESVEITTKRYSVKQAKKNKNVEYDGAFLKSEKLTSSGVVSYNVAISDTITTSSVLTDEELFKACGGRTAHKGARHGLKLNGKLSRIEKQEKMLLKKMKNVSLTDNVPHLEKKIKKVKKQKNECTSRLVEDPESNSTKNKHKKKRKSVSFNNEAVIKYYTPDELNTSHESGKDENASEATLSDSNSNSCDEGIEQDIDFNNRVQDAGHGSFEIAQRTVSDLSKAERKKLKKKRKLEKKKCATEKFLEEVRTEMCIDEKCKKRKLVLSETDNYCKKVDTEASEYSKKKKCISNKERRLEKLNKPERLVSSIVDSMDSFTLLSEGE